MGAHAKAQNKLLDTSRTKAEANYDDTTGIAKDRSATAYGERAGERSGLKGRYGSLADNGGFDPSDFDAIRATYGGGGGGGGSSVASSLAGTGGIDESKFDEALGGYSKFAQGGGVDAAGMIARATRAVPSFYKNLGNEADRQKLVNPYAPTWDASTASRTRQGAQQAGDAARDAELDVGNLVSENKKFGISGLGSLNTNIQDMIQRGKIAGGEQEISNASLAEQRAGRGTNAELAILDAKNQNRLSGIGGLQGLYDTSGNEARGYNQDRQAGYGDQNQVNQGYIGARTDPSSGWKNGLKTAASIAGQAGLAYATGGGSLIAKSALKSAAKKKAMAGTGGM